MKIYTKTGDKGQTSLYGGTRVPKYHLRIEAYGTVDELNSHIGLLKDQKISDSTAKTLLKVQNELFTVGAMLATPPEKETLKSGKERLNIPKISVSEIEYLEQEIDIMQKSLPQMTHFVLPGGHQTVSFCHIARCVCRRAERLTVHLNDNESINILIITYLNRLSDYLFVLARKLTYDNQVKEIPWLPSKDNELI
ncbi:cob(I)yrinic acid a,c-diamide adenosyltransferase [Aureibaculum sp. 2210JD6-5]|uniref:cob(I)yrinic acid a,c-diamide adenosyltransferase n=1 Tax=Aureibaculum sp. 2210JD6-5 TaxID=3103957 RepID=UPI002AAE0B76|nr:cob(I)yrinic acid a,c-diamide adenosyltransferase [Aureibaculum sp. 2210JD6-5]MDY7393640.1 cob(I)yrinic acid a,c-diamide adenosyltransferase [Aureibaculum sp. 2210JD6-5]